MGERRANVQHWHSGSCRSRSSLCSDLHASPPRWRQTTPVFWKMQHSLRFACCGATAALARHDLRALPHSFHAAHAEQSGDHTCRRGACTAARASVDDSGRQSDEWPRRGQPDLEDNANGEDPSWSTAGSIDEAQLAKNRETFLLRLASLGFGAVLVGERVTGSGVVQALGHPTGVSLYELDLALGLLIGALFLGGLAPTRFIYSSVKDKPRSLFDDVPTLLGRLSCIGLGSTFLAEAVTGKGVLGLLNLETGTESLTEAEFALVFLILLVATNLKSPPDQDAN